MKKSKGKSSKWSYAAKLSIGLGGFAGGLYYLLDHFLTKEKQIENKEEKDNNPEIHNLSFDTAIKIILEINNKTDKILEIKEPGIEMKRRQFIFYQFEYEKICEEIIEIKFCVSTSVLSKYGCTNNDIRKCFKSFSPIEIWKRLSIDEPEFNGDPPNKDLVLKAFVYYGERFIDQFSKFQQNNNNTGYTPFQEDYIIYELEFLKIRIDDELYNVHKINGKQLRYLLLKYNLYDDLYVNKIIMEMSMHGEIFTIL